MGSAEGARPTSGGRLRVVVVGILALVGLILLGRWAGSLLPEVLAWIEANREWAAAAYIATYIVATVAWVPGSILTISSGVLFGPLLGTAFTIVGATTGAALAFLIARHLARDRIAARVEDSPRMTAVDRAIGREGWKVVFLIRLSPIFPFNLLNYVLGLTRVSFRGYVMASAIGMIPGSFLYVYSGYAAGQVAAGAAGGTERGIGYWLLLAAGLAATVAVTWIVTRTARRALRLEDSELEDGDPSESAGSDLAVPETS